MTEVLSRDWMQAKIPDFSEMLFHFLVVFSAALFQNGMNHIHSAAKQGLYHFRCMPAVFSGQQLE